MLLDYKTLTICMGKFLSLDFIAQFGATEFTFCQTISSGVFVAQTVRREDLHRFLSVYMNGESIWLLVSHFQLTCYARSSCLIILGTSGT
jgi:hypothetical protein